MHRHTIEKPNTMPDSTNTVDSDKPQPDDREAIHGDGGDGSVPSTTGQLPSNPTQTAGDDSHYASLQNLASTLNKQQPPQDSNIGSIGDISFDSISSPAPSTPFRPIIPTTLRASTARRRNLGIFNNGSNGSNGENTGTTPGAASKPFGPRQPPKSPHVIRAWETKRATTPGRERRRSLRRASHHYNPGGGLGAGISGERDSPMDILRKLSQAIAPSARPFYLDATPAQPAPSPAGKKRNRVSGVVYYSEPEGGFTDEEDSDEQLPPPPRLSLLADPDAQIDRENEAFSHIPPPRLSELPRSSPNRRSSGIIDLTPHQRRSIGRRRTTGSGGIGGGSDDMGEDDSTMLDADTTFGSIELPRRAPPPNSRMSFGFDFNIDDRFQDLHELGRDAATQGLQDGDGDVTMGDMTMERIGYDVGEGESDDDGFGRPFNDINMGETTQDFVRAGLISTVDADATGVGDDTTADVGGLADESIGAFELPVPDIDGETGVATTMDDEQDEDRDENEEEEGESEEEKEEEEEEEEEDEAEDSLMETSNYKGSAIQDSPEYFAEDSPEEGAIFNKPAATGKVSRPLTTTKIKAATRAPKAPLRLSKYGHPVPSLPTRLVKKLASNFSGGKPISNDTLAAIMKASDTFFESVSESVGTFADHAGRKTVGDEDVELLLKRQRHINPQTTIFSLAEKYLPRELLQEIRMPVPPKGVVKKRQQSRLRNKGKEKASGGSGSRLNDIEGEVE